MIEFCSRLIVSPVSLTYQYCSLKVGRGEGVSISVHPCSPLSTTRGTHQQHVTVEAEYSALTSKEEVGNVCSPFQGRDVLLCDKRCLTQAQHTFPCNAQLQHPEICSYSSSFKHSAQATNHAAYHICILPILWEQRKYSALYKLYY